MQSLPLNSIVTFHFNRYVFIQIGSVSTTQVNRLLANNLLTPQKNTGRFQGTLGDLSIEFERKTEQSEIA